MKKLLWWRGSMGQRALKGVRAPNLGALDSEAQRHAFPERRWQFAVFLRFSTIFINWLLWSKNHPGGVKSPPKYPETVEMTLRDLQNGQKLLRLLV